MSKGKLLLPLLGVLLLPGCQTSPPKGAQPAEPPKVVQLSLEQRWQASADAPRALDSLLSRMLGSELRNNVRKGATTPAAFRRVLDRMESAAGYTRRAREIVAKLYGYRKAGGVALNTSWEGELWKRLRTHHDSSQLPAPDVSDQDLLSARRSLAAQIAKAWFYEKGVHQLRQRSIEVQELYQQVLERHQTSKQLERGNHDVLLATRKELARADARAKQLKKAENLAHKALMILTGNRGIRVDQKSSMMQLPAGLSLQLLVERPDVYRNAENLVESGSVDTDLARLLSDVPLTAKGGRASRELNKWSRYTSEQLWKELGLFPESEAQKAVLEVFSGTLLSALKEVRRFLASGRKLMGQRSDLQSRQPGTRRQVNKLRARYSARRADLTDILKAQIELAEITGKLSYVQNRVFGQRLDSYLACGGAGF